MSGSKSSLGGWQGLRVVTALLLFAALLAACGQQGGGGAATPAGPAEGAATQAPAAATEPPTEATAAGGEATAATIPEATEAATTSTEEETTTAEAAGEETATTEATEAAETDATTATTEAAGGEPTATPPRDFPNSYGWGGFYDAINVDTGVVSRYYLALDQGMIMAALANELKGDRLQRYFTKGEIERAIRPLLAMEEFTAGE